MTSELRPKSDPSSGPLTGLTFAVLDAERVFRDALVAMLTDAGGSVVLNAGTVAEFSACVGDAHPMIAIVDLRAGAQDGPGLDGVAALRDLRRRKASARGIVLSSCREAALVASAFAEGAWGYLHKASTSSASLVAAAAAVARGERLIPAELASSIFSGLPIATDLPAREMSRLTARERQVLGEVGNGADNLKIAAMLGISERTVKAHVAALYQKLAADNRVQLALRARELCATGPVS